MEILKPMPFLAKEDNTNQEFQSQMEQLKQCILAENFDNAKLLLSSTILPPSCNPDYLIFYLIKIHVCSKFEEYEELEDSLYNLFHPDDGNNVIFRLNEAIYNDNWDLLDELIKFITPVLTFFQNEHRGLFLVYKLIVDYQLHPSTDRSRTLLDLGNLEIYDPFELSCFYIRVCDITDFYMEEENFYCELMRAINCVRYNP